MDDPADATSREPHRSWPFANRVEAGHELATRLAHLAAEHPVVLGLPRGGVPVADVVARALDAELDVIVVRKLGVPAQPELAMGAVGEHGIVVRNDDVLSLAGVDDDDLRAVERREAAELARRVERFRRGAPPLPLAGRTAIVVDDGIATGATARAALQVARALGARRVVLAVPVAAPETLALLRDDADEVVAVMTPSMMWAVGAWYRDFSAVQDDEVVRILDAARARRASPAAGANPAAAHPAGPADPADPADPTEVGIAVDGVMLRGSLAVPAGATGLVIFAHGSGSSRLSPRNRAVAEVLRRAGLATLLFDLLTPAEEADRRNVFDIALLAHRLAAVTGWAGAQPATAGLAIGWFGASTGAGAALRAAADPASPVVAVVSRGGRPDLAGDALGAVRAPTLLLVGGLDTTVIELNRQARARMTAPCQLLIVPGATHLFEEPGTLAQVADAAAAWFTSHLLTRPSPGLR